MSALRWHHFCPNTYLIGTFEVYIGDVNDSLYALSRVAEQQADVIRRARDGSAWTKISGDTTNKVGSTNDD